MEEKQILMKVTEDEFFEIKRLSAVFKKKSIKDFILFAIKQIKEK